jgi:hypothetical protein
MYWRFLATSTTRFHSRFERVEVQAISSEEIANKRVAVKPSTWEALSNLRKPGETFDELLVSLITAEQRHRLYHDLDVAAAEPSVPWKQAAKQLGI